MRKVSRVELNWEAAYASRYKILTSIDGTTFSEAADVSITSAGTKDHHLRRARRPLRSHPGRYPRHPLGDLLLGSKGIRAGGHRSRRHLRLRPRRLRLTDLALNDRPRRRAWRLGFRPDKAVDGSSTTRWSSQLIDNQWWQVDLGSASRSTKVELNWEAAYASRYKILTSTDGTTFSEAADVSITSPGLKTDHLPARSARYVRIQGVTRGTPWGISFWDARVFGP